MGAGSRGATPWGETPRHDAARGDSTTLDFKRWIAQTEAGQSSVLSAARLRLTRSSIPASGDCNAARFRSTSSQRFPRTADSMARRRSVACSSPNNEVEPRRVWASRAALGPRRSRRRGGSKRLRTAAWRVALCPRTAWSACHPSPASRQRSSSDRSACVVTATIGSRLASPASASRIRRVASTRR